MRIALETPNYRSEFQLCIEPNLETCTTSLQVLGNIRSPLKAIPVLDLQSFFLLMYGTQTISDNSCPNLIGSYVESPKAVKFPHM